MCLSQRRNRSVPDLDLDELDAFDLRVPAWNLSCWCAWGHATKVKAAIDVGKAWSSCPGIWGIWSNRMH
jgi:hypothetical protein